MDVSQWIEGSGHNKRTISRLSGVARTTVDRLIKDVRPAKWDSLEEVAAACGLQLQVVTEPLADGMAAEAARVELEPGFVPSDPSGARRWVERLRRWQSDPANEQEFLDLAARAANLVGRPDLRRYPVEQLEDLIAEASASDRLWALSLAERSLENEAVPMILWVEDTSPIILEVDEPSSPIKRVGTTGFDKESSATEVWLLQAPQALFQNAVSRDGRWYVSGIQETLDRLSVGGH